jgi:SsrA-binding protein
MRERGQTLIPLKMYFKNGKVKLEMALAKGKKEYDRRETIKKRDIEREMRKGFKEKRKL